MNLNMLNDSQIKIILFLKKIQSQLINYNSIRLEDLKKIIAIDYMQKTNKDNNLEINNLLVNIESYISECTKVYEFQNTYEKDCTKILANIINTRIIEEIKK